MGFAIRLDEATPRLRALAGSIQGKGGQEKFKMRWGAVIRKKAAENAIAKGGRRFWRQIARSINIAQQGSHVFVESDHVAAAQKQFGGVIKAKGKAAGGADALTIPIAEEAEGQSAAKFALSGLRLYTRGNVLGYWSEEGFRALFALVRQTKHQKPDPFIPEENEMLEMGLDEAERMVNV